jgi:hypothetical protein
VSVKQKRYELPSQAVKKVFAEEKDAYKKNEQKLQEYVKQGDATQASKLLDGQIKGMIEKEGYTEITADEAKFEYVNDLFNKLCNDDEAEKSGLNTSKNDIYYLDNRDAFFTLMSGNTLPEIDPSMPLEEKEIAQRLREKFIEKFNKIPEEKKIGIIKNYERQAKKREKIAETLNKFNVQMEGQKIDWKTARLNGEIDWYHQFETVRNTPNFRKYLAEDK